MSYKVELDKAAEYVEIVFAGEVTREDHESARAEAIDALKAGGYKRLLVDARRIDAKMSLIDDFEFTQEHQATPIRAMPTAIIHRPDESERFKFIENVASNRGAQIKVFTDPEQAIGWLTHRDSRRG